MMDGERLQQRVYSGYEKAAKRVGLPHDHYRPINPLSPIGPSSHIGTILAAVSEPGSDYAFKAAEYHRESTVRLLADGRILHIGDYIHRNGRYWFVASMAHIRSIIAVRCDLILTLKRPQAPGLNGLNGYGADIRPLSTTVAAGWPASVQIAGHGRTDEPLPSDAGAGRRRILLPPMGVTVLHSDILEDEDTNRYTIMAAERTELGWRIDAMHAVA